MASDVGGRHAVYIASVKSQSQSPKEEMYRQFTACPEKMLQYIKIPPNIIDSVSIRITVHSDITLMSYSGMVMLFDKKAGNTYLMNSGK